MKKRVGSLSGLPLFLRRWECVLHQSAVGSRLRPATAAVSAGLIICVWTGYPLPQLGGAPEARVFGDRHLGAGGQGLPTEFPVDDRVKETHIGMLVGVPTVEAARGDEGPEGISRFGHLAGDADLEAVDGRRIIFGAVDFQHAGDRFFLVGPTPVGCENEPVTEF